MKKTKEEVDGFSPTICYGWWCRRLTEVSLAEEDSITLWCLISIFNICTPLNQF